MAAATTITPIPSCVAATASCRSTSTCRAVRRPPRRWCTASCSCRKRSVAAPTSATTRWVSAMSESITAYADRLRARFPDALVSVAEPRGEVGIEVDPAQWLATALALRDEFGFEQLTDVCRVDYLTWGSDEWNTDPSSQGFSRGVEGNGAGRFVWGQSPSGAADAPERRFAAVAHLLSYQFNQRVRLRTFAADDEMPIVDSLTSVW